MRLPLQPRPAAGAPCASRRKRRAPHGFSLIEVLVATTLLVIIVMMVGMVFRQSTLSWDSGIVRADGSMMARSVVGAIERDLRAAVDGRAYSNAWTSASAMEVYVGAENSAPDTIKFIALLEKDSSPSKLNATREPTLVWYGSPSGSTPDVTVLLSRYAQPLVYNGTTWVPGPVKEETALLYKNKTDTFTPTLWIYAPTAAGQGNDMPLWVNIKIDLSNTEDFSGVRARSLGRDGKPGTSDDIVTQ